LLLWFFFPPVFFVSILYLKIPEELKVSALIVLGSITVVITLMIFLQLKGVYGILNRLARIFPRSRKWFLEKEEILRQFDRNMHTPFKHSRLKTGSRLFSAFCFALAGGCWKVYVIFRALNLSTSPAKVLFISVFVVIVNTAFFLIPGQLGAAEGANLLAATAVGYPATVGLSLGLVRRARKVVYALATVVLILIGRQKI